MTTTPLRKLVDNWDAKHSHVVGSGYKYPRLQDGYCDTCDLIAQLQRLPKEMGE